MKANTPEKLYLLPNGLISYCRSSDEDVEYTRTDAFIEKTRKWFEKQSEWRDLNGNCHCDMESFEDFREYIKGE